MAEMLLQRSLCFVAQPHSNVYRESEGAKSNVRFNKRIAAARSRCAPALPLLLPLLLLPCRPDLTFTLFACCCGCCSSLQHQTGMHTETEYEKRKTLAVRESVLAVKHKTHEVCLSLSLTHIHNHIRGFMIHRRCLVSRPSALSYLSASCSSISESVLLSEQQVQWIRLPGLLSVVHLWDRRRVAPLATACSPESESLNLCSHFLPPASFSARRTLHRTPLQLLFMQVIVSYSSEESSREKKKERRNCL